MNAEPSKGEATKVKSEPNAEFASASVEAKNWAKIKLKLTADMTAYKQLDDQLQSGLRELLANLPEQTPESYADAQAKYRESHFDDYTKLAKLLNSIGNNRRNLEESLLVFNGLKEPGKVVSEKTQSELDADAEATVNKAITDSQVRAILISAENP
ncbi:MAG: hypothetical protein SFY80_03700 [Verrucomicrobiota bacterium]|nr:hypothetical protein [Verrucomicrobiota bacterium]